MQICISVRFQICHRLTELFPKPRDNDALRPGSVTLAAERLGEGCCLNMEAVLISGASRGIGRAATEILSQAGYRVFAGYRKDSDRKPLADLGAGVHPLRLDVTRDEDALEAVQAIRESGLSFRAVINNAGFAIPGPVELLPVSEYRRQFETNYLGAIRLIQATLPLLRLYGPGARIINVSSIVGWITPPLLSAYSGSKYAMESLNDALRVELAHAGIFTVSIQPGAIATDFSDTARREGETLLNDRELSELPEAYQRMAGIRSPSRKGPSSPDLVGRVILRALTARRPRSRYFAGNDAKIVSVLKRLLSDRAWDSGLRRVMT